MDELSINELRDLAIKRHRAVGQKVSRTRRRNGAELEGTAYDPRRDVSAIKRYNKRQLQAVIKSYNRFTSRSTQFVGDADGKPITAEAWQKYKASETGFNQASQDRFARLSDTPVPGKNMTAAEYRASRVSEFPRMADAAVNDPYGSYNRTPRNVRASQLEKLTKDMKKRATNKDFSKRLQTSKDVANEMLDKIGGDAMKAKIGKLTAKQFEWLWNVSSFANSLSLRYHTSKEEDDDSPRSWVQSVADDQEPEMDLMLNAARKVK